MIVDYLCQRKVGMFSGLSVFLSLSLLHSYQILLFVHKFTHDRHKLPAVFTAYFTQKSSIHQYDTRIKSNFFVTCLHTTFGRRALMYKGPALWINLPHDLKMLQFTTTFKSKQNR